MATTAEDATAMDKEAKTKKTPIILLSGFLGTGKTSALTHLLENTEGAKIGVIVNDVASVNIDAKLVSSMPDSAASEDMIELQNGCACCSLSDELFTSVETLIRPKKGQQEKRNYDAIVVELSGVADPMAIKATWTAAAGTPKQFPATAMAEISKVVTMIDACTFGTDYMTWDAAMERPGWVDEGDACSGQRKVAELLAEQVEAAQLILVNKIDMATPAEVDVASKVARALNTKAVLHEVEFGKIKPQEILGLGESKGTGTKKKEKEASSSHTHSGHDHEACNDPECTDESHDHSHSHDHTCEDPGCTDASHSHSHDHSSEDEPCIDPGCTDTSHSHSHSHATSTDNLGIVNFVYKAARPFDMARLMALLHTWPVSVKDTLDLQVLADAQEGGYAIDGVEQQSPFLGVIRSKGFCWIAPIKWTGLGQDAYRHDTAMYWSHAGKHFGLAANGKWWGSILVYEGWQNYMKKLFQNNMEEYERIMREDFVSEEFGDRRQEVVFIGTNLDEQEIRKALDNCLLTDEELETYRQNLDNYQKAVLSATASKSLYDMGG
jgi:G3E family GTPase